MSMKGLEPSRDTPLEPKPSASTNSATSTCYLCLGIEPSFHVCCPPVLTNRLPEDWEVLENFPARVINPLTYESPIGFSRKESSWANPQDHFQLPRQDSNLRQIG